MSAIVSKAILEVTGDATDGDNMGVSKAMLEVTGDSAEDHLKVFKVFLEIALFVTPTAVPGGVRVQNINFT